MSVFGLETVIPLWFNSPIRTKKGNKMFFYEVTSTKTIEGRKDTRVTGTSSLALSLSVLKDCGYTVTSIKARDSYETEGVEMLTYCIACGFTTESIWATVCEGCAIANGVSRDFKPEVCGDSECYYTREGVNLDGEFCDHAENFYSVFQWC